MSEYTKLYKEGDRVLLKKDTRFWSYNDKSNPQGVPGTITRIGESSYTVQWDGLDCCVFQDEDLEPLEKKLELLKLESNSLYV